MTFTDCTRRKEGRKIHANIGDCEDISVQGHEEYFPKRKERLIIAANNRRGNTRTERK